MPQSSSTTHQRQSLLGSSSQRVRIQTQSLQHETFASRASQVVATRLSRVGAGEVTRKGTVTGVSINTLCNVMGAGVLSLPLAFYNASVVPGLLLLLFIGLMSAYAVYCLVAGCDATGHYSVTEVVASALFPTRTLSTYLEAQSALDTGDAPVTSPVRMQNYRRAHAVNELLRRRRRRWAMVLVELVIFLSNYGTLIIYTKVIVDSIPPVLEHAFGLEGVLVSQSFWLITSGVVFFVLSCARNMEELKWSSLLGFLTILYIVVAVVYRFHTARTVNYPDVSPESRGTIRWCELLSTALLSISTYGVAFGYHFNVPYFYRELQQRTPTEMMKSVGVAFPIIIACYVAAGLFGYLTFGNEIASREVGGNVVASYPSHDALMNLGRLGLFLHFVCVFPVVSICARRGLHRLVMTALMWQRQSEAMELTVLSGEDGEEEGEAAAPPPPAHETAGSAGPHRPDGESTPLLTARASEDDLDRDPGSPDDTTFFAIVVEAFFLVSTTVVIGGMVSGISIVIDVIGTLFGVFLILIVPGIIGLCIFSTSYTTQHGDTEDDTMDGTVGGMEGEAHAFPGRRVRYSVRYARLKRILCLLSVVCGVLLTIVGVCLFIKEHFIDG